MNKLNWKSQYNGRISQIKKIDLLFDICQISNKQKQQLKCQITITCYVIGFLRIN
jgi:hypothetical protein